MSKINKIDWSNIEERRKYNREYNKKRRHEGYYSSDVSKGKCTRLRVRPIKVEQKRDLFEVTAILYKALKEVIENPDVKVWDISKALTVYEQYWREE